jgi:hypothetical protein
MCPVTGNTACCKIHAITCFLQAKNIIHHELSAVDYGQNAINEGPLRQWQIMFKVEQANKCAQ